jgi:hypothetical protein
MLPSPFAMIYTKKIKLKKIQTYIIVHPIFVALCLFPSCRINVFQYPYPLCAKQNKHHQKK